jgi:hypothetical protein
MSESQHAQPSAKVVRLTRGRHHSPEHGACIAELVSMLAEEPFSDHPGTACPAVMAFLRGYNDSVGEEPRQELFALAVDLLGTRGDDTLAARRMERISEFATRHGARSPMFRWSMGPFAPSLSCRCETAGAAVARRCGESPEAHARVRAFVRELIGPQPATAMAPEPERVGAA